MENDPFYFVPSLKKIYCSFLSDIVPILLIGNDINYLLLTFLVTTIGIYQTLFEFKKFPKTDLQLELNHK